MKDFVVYTIIVGGYDEVKQPIVTDDRFDYILFTDDISKPQIGVWQVREIPYKDDNLMRLSRYAKCLPTKVLPEYKASLYIDGTLQIATNFVYDRFIELYEKNVEWAGIKHYYRNCLYEEMRAIIGAFGRGVHDYDEIEWYAKLKKEGFPSEYGLYENNVIFRIHDIEIERIGQEWWETMQYYCKRDQFSLMYIFWKKEISRDFFLVPEEDAKHTTHFIYTLHETPRPILQMNYHERLRYRCWLHTKWYNEWFGGVLEHAYRLPFPKIALYEWEIYAVFRYLIPSKLKKKTNVFLKKYLRYE